MPFIVSSPAAAPPPTLDHLAPARSANPDPSQPGSFGEAMARSHECRQEKVADAAVLTKAAPLKQIRRPADAVKRPAQDTVDPIAALLVALESKLPPGGGPAAAKAADRTLVQSRDAAASNGMAVGADPCASTALADAVGARVSDLPSGPGRQALNMAGAPVREEAELALDLSAAPPAAGTVHWALPADAAPQQPGGMPAPDAPTPMASALVLPDVGSSEWGKALGQQVLHLGTAGQQVAELQLNPPGLGPLKVTLSLNDHQMQAAFVSAHSSVLTAVEAALPQLRALLAESGISLGHTSVGAESQAQTAFSNGQGNSGSQPPYAAPRGSDADTTALFPAPPVALQLRSLQGLGIDTYA